MNQEAGIEIDRGGYVNIIEKDSKQIDLRLNEYDQEELNKLIYQHPGAYKLGLDIIRYGFYYKGNLYSISSRGSDYKITNRDYAGIIKLAFQSENYNLKEFSKFYVGLFDKNLYNIISTIVSGMNFTSSDDDYNKILDYADKIPEEQINLLNDISEIKSKYIDMYFFDKNIIFYRNGGSSEVESGNFKPMKDNEIFYSDYALNMGRDNIQSAGNLFTFPSNDDREEFYYTYCEHFRKIMIPALHKLFNGKI